MAKKTKIQSADIALTVEQVGAIIGEVADLQLAHDAELLALNTKLNAARATHEPELKRIGDEIKAKTLQVEAFVRANAETMFQEPRSQAFPRGEIGLRWGQWAVTTLKGVTQKEAVKRLLSFRWGKSFLRQPDPQLDKDALLKARETLKPERLMAAGIAFEREETFFLEIKQDAATPSASAAA